jgi:hypothetical protein
LQSNYVIQAEINIKKHPEWDMERKVTELARAYNKENKTCYAYDNMIYVMPVDENKPIKIIYVGE